MTEGSVEIDNGAGTPIDNSNAGDQAGASYNDDQGGNAGGAADDQGHQDDGKDGGEGGANGVSDKGTKLDNDPLSRANQLRANAERKVQQYERVLSSPELLREFAKKAGYSLAEAKEILKDAKDDAEEQAFKPDQFNTKEDLAKTFNSITASHKKEVADLKKEIEELKSGLTGFRENDRVRSIAANMSNDITSVQEKYSELNPKSADYDPDLEKEITSLYVELDAVDPSDPSKGMKGNVSLAKLADRIMAAAGRGQKKGSENAQTQVRVKQAGRVVTTGGKPNNNGGESSNPDTSIALKIARAMGSRR